MQSKEFQTFASSSNIIVDVAQDPELPDSYRINVTLEDASIADKSQTHWRTLSKFGANFNAKIEENSDESSHSDEDSVDESRHENLEIEQDINQRLDSTLKKGKMGEDLNL